LGYKLFIKNPTTSIEWLAFDGHNLGLADQVQYTVYDLETGQDYLFSVQAVNFNGVGANSTDV